MEKVIDCDAKKLVSQYVKANSDYELISDREQKAELRKDIELKRAHRNDLQRLISGLTILKQGIRLGGGSANVQATIIQQNHISVRSMVEKHKAQLNQIASGTQLPLALPDVLQTSRDRLQEVRLREVLQCQEQLLAKLRSSRVMLQLEHAKEEALKAQQSFEATESALRLLQQKSTHESEQMLQYFIDVAIQIGEEQERFEQNRVQLDTAAKCREALHGTMDCVREDEAGTLERSDLNDTNATFIGQSDEQQKEGEDTVAGAWLSFSNVEEEFSFGFKFKNPNDFPEILKRIASPRDYETMVKDIEKSSCKPVQEQCSGRKEYIPIAVQGKLKQRRLSTTDVVSDNVDTGSSSPDATDIPVKRQKVMETKTQSCIEQETIQQINSAVAHDSPEEQSKNNRHEITKNSIHGSKENFACEKIQEKGLRKRSEHLGKTVDVVLSDISKNPPNKKPPNAATTLANQGQKLTSSARACAAQKKSSSPVGTFKTPAKVVGVKVPKSPQQKAPPVNAQTGQVSPKPKQKRQTVSHTKPQEKLKTVRNSSPSQPSAATAKPALRTRNQQKKRQTPVDPEPDRQGDEAMDVDDSLVETSLSNESLDFILQSSSSEFDMNLSPIFNNNGGVEDIDMRDLDFLLNDALPGIPAQKKKAKTVEDGDGFNFDFDAQNFSESVDEAEDNFF